MMDFSFIENGDLIHIQHLEKLVWIGCGAIYVADLSNSEWADTTRHTRSTPSASNG